MDTLRRLSPSARGARQRLRAALLIVALGLMATLLAGCVDFCCVDHFATPLPTDFAPISVENDTPAAVRIRYGIGDARRDVHVRGGEHSTLFKDLSAGQTESFDFDLGERAGSPRCTTLPIVARTLDDRDVALIPPPICAGARLPLSYFRAPSP